MFCSSHFCTYIHANICFFFIHTIEKDRNQGFGLPSLDFFPRELGITSYHANQEILSDNQINFKTKF
jgi:hypothetical protein